MYFHAGFAARNGMAAAQLARAGAFAAPNIVEGEAGLFRAIGRCEPPDDIPLYSGNTFEILSVFHKQAPACNYAQTPCQAALRAARQFNGSASEITAITVRCTKAAMLYPGCDHTGPFRNSLQAKMSIQFGVAATIASRAMNEANYARIGDELIEVLIGKITLETDDDLTAAYPGKQGAEVTIATKNGRNYTSRLDDVVKADADEVGERFVRSAIAWLGAEQAGRLAAFVANITTENDVRKLNGLCLPIAG
jgi:2-methylcitrate dehydratase PrpD